MKYELPPITIDNIKRSYTERRIEIENKLAEFAEIGRTASDPRLFEEMVFCFFTGGCSARMGLRSVEAIRPILMTADQVELANALAGSHRYPNSRAKYVVHSREGLTSMYGMELGRMLNSFSCPLERRDWLVRDKSIKGLGYKEASHYLRNIGYRGYAILDKHVLNCMVELKIISEAKPPNTRSQYLNTEGALQNFTKTIDIDFDELDLVLWSMKTGMILK